MDWTPFYITFAILILALWILPASLELALFRFRCWRVRRERDRDATALLASSRRRDRVGISGRTRRTQMYALHAREPRVRVDHHNDAA